MLRPPSGHWNTKHYFNFGGLRKIWRTAPKGRGKPRPLDSRPVGDRSLSPTPPWQVSGLMLSDPWLRRRIGTMRTGAQPPESVDWWHGRYNAARSRLMALRVVMRNGRRIGRGLVLRWEVHWVLMPQPLIPLTNRSHSPLRPAQINAESVRSLLPGFTLFKQESARWDVS
jgi:hypothetical protein